VEAQIEITIENPVEVPLTGVSGRAAGGPPEREIEVEVPPPPADHGQMVLYQDESGAVTWSFQVPEEETEPTDRGLGARLYRIRQPSARAGAADGRLLGGLVNKAIKVLNFPIFEEGVGKVANHFAGKWETKKRPYKVRWFRPEGYEKPAETGLEPADWRAMKGERVLLMVHGTFSQCHTGMGAFPHQFMKDLAARYDNRIVGFDHLTVSKTPTQNVEQFISMLPEDVDVEFDIICHSRGGLVSRVLAEKQSELSIGARAVSVKKVIFVATPNNGTRLADVDHFDRLIDGYTNILSLIPAPGAVEVMETVIAVAKQLAVNALKGLTGLSCMVPDEKYLKKLNEGPPTDSKYFAMASNFEPSEAGALLYLRDALMDEIFGVDNDLIVPTNGVFEANGSKKFPIADIHSYPAADGIQHSGFFANKAVTQQMTTWLAAP
jgi:pimeloyl-ACP methyl ester carboxylesterase